MIEVDMTNFTFTYKMRFASQPQHDCTFNTPPVQLKLKYGTSKCERVKPVHNAFHFQ